jgi:phage anti-repressor protein
MNIKKVNIFISLLTVLSLQTSYSAWYNSKSSKAYLKLVEKNSLNKQKQKSPQDDIRQNIILNLNKIRHQASTQLQELLEKKIPSEESMKNFHTVLVKRYYYLLDGMTDYISIIEKNNSDPRLRNYFASAKINMVKKYRNLLALSEQGNLIMKGNLSDIYNDFVLRKHLID